MDQWRPRPGGLIDCLLKRGEVFYKDDLLKAIERLELEHLDFFAILCMAEALDKSFIPDAETVQLSVYLDILRYFFGHKWTNENTFGIHKEVSPQNREGRAFFKSDLADADSLVRWKCRVSILAECLFSMQDIHGIKQRIEMIKAGDLESVHGELLCAKMVAAPIFELRFIIPSGVKGDDYDCEITAPGGRILHCEIKTKEEHSDYGAKTIYNTLEHARRQLPKELPSIIFLRVPEAWAKEEACAIATKESFDRILRQSHRVVAIVLAWEEWHSLGTTAFAHFKYHVEHNTKSRFYSSDIARCFQLIGTTKNSDWTKIASHLAKSYLALLAFADSGFRFTEPPSVQ
jgi:hypothetical protein